jgi:hypothetical protein
MLSDGLLGVIVGGLLVNVGVLVGYWCGRCRRH